MRCDACGTMNKETSRFCLYCGASLTSTTPEGSAASAAPSPSANPASPPIGPRAIPARPAYVPRPRTPDYVGLFGVAFLLLVLVVSLEAAVIAVLLFIYIGTGLYWTTPRWRPAVEGTYRSPRP